MFEDLIDSISTSGLYEVLIDDSFYEGGDRFKADSRLVIIFPFRELPCDWNFPCELIDDPDVWEITLDIREKGANGRRTWFLHADDSGEASYADNLAYESDEIDDDGVEWFLDSLLNTSRISL